jgi:hypothetical protein
LRSSLIGIASNFVFATCKCLAEFAGQPFPQAEIRRD